MTATDLLAPLAVTDANAIRARALTRPVAVDLATPVGAHVRRHAAARPGAVAVVDGDDRMTYADLLDHVRTWRRHLAAAGARPGDLVAVTGRRCADVIAAFLAIEALGAAYLWIEADWPAARVADALRRGGVRVAVRLEPAGAGHADLVAAAALVGVPVITAPTRSGPAEHRPAEHGPAENDQPGPDERRYVVFTSGTTGRPKGAAVGHRGMLNHLWAKVNDLGLTAADRVAFTAPLGFDIAIWQMLAALLAGGRVVVVREPDVAFPQRLVGRLRDESVTVVELVPTVIGWITKELRRRGAATRLDQLRWLISTGEELVPAQAGPARAAMPGVRLLNAYGPTECSDDVTHHEVVDADLHRRRLPIGAPVGNAVLYVLVDGPHGWRAAEPGEAGELFVGGVPVGLGYVNDPAATAAAFFRDSVDPGSTTGRLYRTGDLAYAEDGVVHYLGRVDRQVKVGGVRMELDEVEAALSRHTAVTGCAAVLTGEQRPQLHAFYVADRPVRAEDLRAHLAGLLPAAMVPRRWTALPEMPLTANGKTDYRALSAGQALPVASG